MSRRSTPERIDEARRAATRNRLMGEGMTEATAEAWIGAWEAQAATDGLERGAAYWQAGWAWIAELRRKPGVSLGPLTAGVGCSRERP